MLLIVVLSILMSGCVTNKKITYLQDYPEDEPNVQRYSESDSIEI